MDNNNVGNAAAIKAGQDAANSIKFDPASAEKPPADAKSDLPKGMTVGEESDPIKEDMPSKSEVTNTINDSEDLTSAVESVADMYHIPSSHVISDPCTDRIVVTKGHIVVPSNSKAKPSENGKMIIQSIGALLDYISQRADDKLDQFQADNIRNGINQDKIQTMVDPSKGNVVATQFDANGDPVIVYDSGLADMEHSEAGRNKFDEMKSKGLVPEFEYKDPDKMGYSNSYFTKEEDEILPMDNTVPSDTSSPASSFDTSSISSSSSNDTNEGRDSNPFADMPSDKPDGYDGPSPETMNVNDNTTETNISQQLSEQGYLLDAMSVRGNTRHLGYDIMQEQGFTFVKPCDFFVESAARKKNKQTVALGIDHMKFDNTKLLRAIKLMNEARAEQNGGKGKINLEALINNPKYQEAIDCLNSQFNARLNIRFVKNKQYSNSEFTTIYNDIKTHLVISKSKGFQLGGLPIDIFVINTALDEDAPDDKSLFGQHVISVFCHEIFHNIMAVLKSKEAQFTAALVETMTLAKDIPSAKNRRKLITNFVDTIDEFGGLKMNIFTKRAMIKHLTYLSTITHNEQALREYEKAIKSKNTKTIDDQIKNMEKRILVTKVHTYGPGRYIIPAFWTVIGILALNAGTLPTCFALMLLGASIGSLSGTLITHSIEIDTIKKFKNGTIKNYEEHWCDMFAACYNLPVTFFLIGSPRHDAADKYPIETLKRYDELQREYMQLAMIKYPTMMERNQSAVKYAKKTLDSKVKLDPSIRKYLEWIVNNYSKSLNIDIDEIYSKGTFDPKTAEDLDGHIEKLISSANINVTESDISWLDDLVDDTEYYY